MPASFLEHLTPQAATRVVKVHAVHLHPLKHPIAFYLRPVNTVVYGHNGPSTELRHEAMHALDPCGFKRTCTELFAKGVPPRLARTARDLYGKKSWSSIEYWAVFPAWYLWEPDMMPLSVRRSYSSVFRIE